jgi:hypothetical protein
MKNPVAKHARKFNKGGPMRDRKKDDKRGYMKHKGKQQREDDQQTDTTGHTNAAAKKPQDYTDPVTGKRKTRMVPVHKDVQNEKLDPSMGVKKYIDDFQKSDAPQFQGKSKEKRKEMAIAAYLDAKRGEKKEGCWDGYKQVGMKKKDGKSVPNCVPESVNELSVKTLNNYRRKASKPNPNDSATKQDKRYAGVARAGQKLDKKLESTAAYGQSQAAIRAKKQRAGMSTSDQHKMGKVADMMRREREKRAAQQREAVSPAQQAAIAISKKERGEKPKDEAYNPRASAAQRSAANKMYGRTSDSPSKPKTTSGLDSKGRMIRDKDPAASRRAAGALSKAIATKYGTKKEDAEARARLKLKHAKEKENLKNRHSKEREAMKESVNEAMSKVMQDKVRALADKDGVKKMTAADLRKYKAMAKAELKKDKETKKAVPAKPVSKTSKGKVRTGSADPADRNIFMQLRKAQDRGGKQAITVSPTGKKVTLTPSQIDMLLKRHDSIQKPVDKRKFKIMLIKSLRAKAK